MRQVVRTIRYQEIADDLRSRIVAGEPGAGRLLPSEAELGERYRASRVTVRKALEVLRLDGLVDARQGYGWFVAGETFRQPLGRLGTIEEQLEQSGWRSERRILAFGFQAAPQAVRDVLGVDEVLHVERVNLADGEPFARVTVWCPAELGAALSRADVERSSFYDLLTVPLGGATQTIGSEAASARDAEVLEIPEGSPVLVCERVTSTLDGRPVLIGHHVFPGHRTVFTVDLPRAPASSIAPSGLRLVE
ncbi:MAG: GntR family transcriptional regulator [Actinobacteria bacterium]|nr:GntR family transcriptional regulator [Actinomycetota bacterium]